MITRIKRFRAAVQQGAEQGDSSLPQAETRCARASGGEIEFIVAARNGIRRSTGCYRARKELMTPQNPHTPLDDFPAPGGETPPRKDVRVPAKPPRGRFALFALGLGLLLIGLNLRIGVAAVGPVIPNILDDLGLSATTTSLLTTVPVVAFGAFAFLTPELTRRMGMHRLLGVAMIVLTAGILLRLHPSLIALFAGTVLVGAAIAVSNVVMPAAVKQDFSHRAGLMMGLYSTSLFIGAALASGLTVPLLNSVNGNWRSALALWALPAIVAALIWIPQMLRSPGRLKKSQGVADALSERREPPFRSILKDPIALAVTAMMGLQSTSYYATLTWVPTIYRDHGMDAHTAGWMISFSAFPAIIASFLTPVLAKKARLLWLPPTICVAFNAVCYIGLATAAVPGAYVWMTCLGLGQGGAISLSLTYIVWRSPDTHHTGRLSTMAQGFGYLFAGLGPVGLGALHVLTGEWIFPLTVLGVLLVAQLLAGVIASQNKYVGAEAKQQAR